MSVAGGEVRAPSEEVAEPHYRADDERSRDRAVIILLLRANATVVFFFVRWADEKWCGRTTDEKLLSSGVTTTSPGAGSSIW